MAEFLGIAGVIGLLQLTLKMVTTGYDYISGVKEASDNQRRLVNELQSLSQVLIILQDHV